MTLLRTHGGAFAAIVAASVLAAIAGTSLAEEEEPTLGMKVGAGSRLLLSLATGMRYASNYYYQDTDEDSAIGLVVSPSALLVTDRGELRYQFSAVAEAGAFDLEGDADDYLDGVLSARFDWQPLTRHYFAGGVSWTSDHDAFGTRRTEAAGLLDRKLDRWEEKGANLVYRFGAAEARINLEGELGSYTREYTTNRDTTQFLDYDTDAARATAYYRISSKTRLLAEVILADIDYDSVLATQPTRAGEVTRYRLGAAWQATGKTKGDLRLGRVERDFDSNLQPDYDEFDWQVSVAWEPRARDRLFFDTGREPEESFLNDASVIDNRYYRMRWEHDWGPRLTTRLRYAFNTLDYRGIAREDDVQELSLGLEYKPTRRWSLFGEIAQQTRDSNLALRDYDNTVVSAGIRLTY
jgi:polysaccharide biosynthesis protein VpsM